MEELKYLPMEEQKYMKELFAKCPETIKASMFRVEVKKGDYLLDQGEPCKYVYILLKGKARGVDMQIQGKIYSFKEFLPGRILGEFECMSGIPEYAISIQAFTDCLFAGIPAGPYVRWMQADGKALFLRTQRLLLELTNETIENRKHLLLSGSDRLIAYFLEQYEKRQNHGKLVLDESRNELSGATGFCVKTINRNVKKLQEQGYISMENGKITISQAQYESMRTYTKTQLL